MVEEYGNYMRGVDSFNQHCAYYSNVHRSRKWYRCIIMWLLEICINNAYLVYQTNGGQLSTLEFRKSIIRSLEAPLIAEVRVDHPRADSHRLVNVHEPFDCDVCSIRNKNEGKRKRCVTRCQKCVIMTRNGHARYFSCCRECFDLHCTAMGVNMTVSNDRF